MSGWKLTAALLVKQVQNLGTTASQMLAGFDPETATEVDRDNLKVKLREISVKLAEARRSYTAEQKEAQDLAAAIAQDEKAAVVLLDKFEAGKLDEAVLVEFTNNLEAMQARLPGEQEDATQAKELVDTLEQILGTVQKNLDDFDANAKKVLRELAQAKADQDRQKLRMDSQAQINALKNGMGGTSTALSALSKKAEKARVQADALAIQADIGQKPIDRHDAVEEARRIASGQNTGAGESAADRLRRLAGGAKAQA